MYVLDNAVGGKRAPSASARTTPVFNPATGEEIGKVPLSSMAEIDAAVQNAKEAQPAWGNLTPAKRAADVLQVRRIAAQACRRDCPRDLA